MTLQELDADSLNQTGIGAERYDVDAVLSEIERQQSGKSSVVKNLAILAITLLIFFRIGLINNTPVGIGILLAVLFLHELGHWLGMRAFGYTNMQMFFIPLFGAAVSGQSRNVPAHKKAIVSLLGPMPGIILAGIPLFLYAVTGKDLFFQLTLMLLLINTFNLLPFFPLDGGRFMNEVLFCRNRWLELIFRIVAALSIIGIAWLLHAWILLAFGVLGLLSTRLFFKLAGVARQIKDQYPVTQESGISDELPDPDGHRKKTKSIIHRLNTIFPSHIPLKQFAGYVKMVMDQVQTQPPKTKATVALLGVYAACFVLAAVMLIGMGLTAVAKTHGQITASVIEFERPDGSPGYKEVRTAADYLISETEIDWKQRLYHGPSKHFYLSGQVQKEGLWNQGKWHGEWKEYDLDGTLTAITQFDNGRFVFRKILKDDVWVDQNWTDLPIFIRKNFEKHQQSPPMGPDQ